MERPPSAPHTVTGKEIPVGAREPQPQTHAQPTIVDVALRAGVSVATVSRALRDYPYVAVATRERVHRAAAELRYVADANAARLASGRSHTIGLVAPILTSWYTSEVIAGVEEVLQVAQLDLLISTGRAPTSKSLAGPDQAFRQRVDGMILVDVFWREEGARELARMPTPAVVVGEKLAAITSLSIDNQLGAEMAARHLLELGHRRIAVVGELAPSGVTDSVPQQRTKGFRRAMSAARIRSDRQLVIDGEFTVEGGRRAARQLLQSSEPPTAMFCMSDEMAFGVLQVAREMGIAVPDELSVIGFDDHPAAEAFGLSTIRQPVRQMGRLAARLMTDILDGHQGTARHHPLGLALVERSSTAPPAQ
jgi:LacI family transcriptional regulator, repressor for deo operon, udp, cdd, tsx, nupC, and nupG